MKRKERFLMIGCAVLAFLLALGITIYPPISTAYNQKYQSQIHTQYQQQIEAADDTEIRAMLEAAATYNEALVPGVQNGQGFTNDALQVASADYVNQLNPVDSGIMGYVEVPSLNVTLPIYHGTEDATLEIGAGHLLGSSLPVGGESTHSIITGHSGMASQKMFSDLDQLEAGDVFYLDVLGETLAYQVDQIKTVLPYETSDLEIIPGEDYCTLVTCTPFGVNSHRLLVRGTRIPYAETVTYEEEVQQTEEADSTWEQEYFKGLAIGVAIVVIILVIALIAHAIWRNNNANT